MWGLPEGMGLGPGLAVVLMVGLAVAFGAVALYGALNRYLPRRPRLSEEDRLAIGEALARKLEEDPAKPELTEEEKELVRDSIRHRYETGEIDLTTYEKELRSFERHAVYRSHNTPL